MDRVTPMRGRARERSGFTLIELMLAFTILSVGLLSLGATQLLVMDYGARGKHDTHAGEIAQARMEQLQRLSWNDPDLQPTGGWTAPDVVDVRVQSDTASYTEKSYEVRTRIADLTPGLTRSIDVRVDWDEPKRPGRRFALSSIRYNLEGL